MSIERYQELIVDLCDVIGLPDSAHVLATRKVEVEGFDVILDHVENDPDAIYVQFDYGITTAGRTLRIFRLMLESNLLVYAQDQAQLGLDPETGGALLIVRIPITDEVDGTWLAETLVHYAEHGTYWRDNMLEASDDCFTAVGLGNYTWMKV
jgi:Tir chaperone protein (CesT) family